MEMGGLIGQNQRRSWNCTRWVDHSVRACLRQRHLK
jgi:hypothetical protein